MALPQIKTKEYTLITGASAGIGKQLAIHYAQAGHSLILVARREKEIRELQKKLQKKSVHIQVVCQDLFKKNAAPQLLKTVEENGWKVRTLINNAGLGDHSSFEDSHWKKINQMIQLNITSATQLTHLFLPHLKQQQKPSIIFISSIASFTSGPFMAVYYATKSYVTSFANALFVEQKNQVHILNVCPGPLATEFSKVANANFKRLSLMMISLSTACEIIYKAHQHQKRQVILGIIPWFLSLLPRFLPTRLTLKITNQINKK